jgi:hypothetical protein
MLLYYKHYVVYNILKQTTNILPHDVPMIFPWKLPIFSMKKKTTTPPWRSPAAHLGPHNFAK